MTIQPKLRKSILDFLTPLPFLQSENGRRALLLSAGLDTVLPSIDLSGSATEFASRLVEDLDQYGTLPAEQPALIRFLQEIKTQVGQDRQETLQTFCDQLQRPRAEIVTQCPYRGLFAFREEDEAYFFGRAAYTQKLLEAVNEKPLIAVIGASGSGKSSVVCAGLIPRLRRQGNWCIAAFRPGESPFRALSAAVIPFLEADLDEIDKIKAIKKLSHELSAGDLALSDITAAILQKHPATRLLLFADQFEELYTLCRADDERRRFLDGLIATFRTDRAGTLTCVLTMRADFLGKALSYRPFGDALQDANLLLSPMNREELQAIIEEPAHLFDVTIEEGLTDRILEAVGNEPGNLPLLEFALTKLWETQAHRTLTHTAYDQIGGVEKALMSHADHEYEKLSPEEQQQARRIFIQLIRPGEGTEDTRRIATKADVGEENWTLVARLADARLVVTEGSRETGEAVEVVHESLIAGWQRLRKWIEADRDFRTWQERLRVVLSQWQKSHDEGALLRGAPLAEAESWLAQRATDLTPEECDFITASLQFRDKELAEREAQRQRELEAARKLAEEQRQRAEDQEQARARLRKWFTFAAIAAVIAVIAAVGAALFFLQSEAQRKKVEQTSARLADSLSQEETARKDAETQRQFAEAAQKDAEDQRDQAERQRQEAITAQRATLKAQSVFWADLARQENEKYNFEAGLLFALDALPQSAAETAARPYSPEAALPLYHALVNLTDRKILQGHAGEVNDAVFSPDGRRIATVAHDGTVRLWDAESGSVLNILRGHASNVWQAAFNADGKRLITASKDATARVWDAETGEVIHVLQGHDFEVLDAAFSPDGSTIVTASLDATARLWDAATGNLLHILNGHTSAVNAAAFSPDGKQIATASFDRTARLWDSQSGELRRVLQGHAATVVSAVFSPDNTCLVTISLDKTIRVWNAQSGELKFLLTGHEAPALSASLSPDSKRLATAGGAEKTARVWDLEQGELLYVLRGHDDDVVQAAFSPDGMHIITAARDATARLWNAESGELLNVFKGHAAPLQAAAFSPDSEWIVTASADQTARLWAVKNHQLATSLKDDDNSIHRAYYSPDGKLIATVGREHGPYQSIVRLWDPVSGQLYREFPHETAVELVRFHPDSAMLVTVCREGDETEAGPQTTVWDVRTGQMLHVFEGRGVLSADGSQVLTNAGKLAHLWDIRDGHEIVRLEHAEPISAAVFSPDDKKIMTRSYSAITIWSTLDGQRLTTIRERRMYFEFPRWQLDRLRAEHLPEVILTVLKSLPDHIFTDDAQLWEFLAKQIGAELLQRYHDRFKDDLQKYEYGFQTALFSPDSRHVLTRCEMPDHDENTVRVWDAVSGQLLFLLEHDAPMATALFTPDGKYILTQKESALNVWDAEHGQPVTSIKETRVAFEVPWRHQLENDLPEDILDRIARLENQTFIGQAAFMNVLVAQIGQEQTERYKDLLLAQARTYHYSFKMIAGAPDSKRLLTLVRVTQDYWEPQSEDTLRLWDVQSGQLFAAFPHAAPVNAAAFSRDGRWLMTVSGRNVSLWQVNTAQLLLTLKHDFPVTSAAFSPDEKQILVTSAAFSPDEDAPLSREQAARVWNIFLPEQPLVVSARQLTSRTSLDVQPQYTELAIARAAVLKSYFWENLNRSFIIPAWHKVKQVLLPFRRLIRKPPDAIG